MGDELPFAADVHIDFARTTLPVEVLFLSIPPERVDIHHGEGPVAFFRRFDAACGAAVVDEAVGGKEVSPVLSPADGIEATQFEHPVDRIMDGAATAKPCPGERSSVKGPLSACPTPGSRDRRSPGSRR